MARVTINGAELFYEEMGSGEPILFHHSYASSHDAWTDVVERMRERYRCVVMDARGAGDSAHPEDGYTLEQMAADVVGLADALGISRFTYVGHSMGGVIGMELGLAHAHRLEKLVLVTPGPADGTELPPSLRERLRRQWREKAREEMIRERTAMTAREAAHPSIPEGVDRALSVSAGHREGCLDAVSISRRGNRLGEIKTPTLMIAGAADVLLSTNLRDFARLGNATLHVFSRVSHAVPREIPAELASVLADFMDHGVVTAATLQAR